MGNFGHSLKKADEALQWKGPLPNLDDAILMDRYTIIDESLGRIVARAERRPVWADAWKHSTRGRRFYDPIDAMASPEERFAVFQMVRDSGDLPRAAGFCLVAHQADFLTDCFIAEQMEQEERRNHELHGEGGELCLASIWLDALKYCGKHPAKWDQLYLSVLVQHGEDEIATIYDKDRRRFQRLMNVGKNYFCSR
jgi:hypothetical protein